MKYGIIILWLVFQSLPLIASEDSTTIPELKNAGVLLLNSQGEAVIATHEMGAFIPASTTKLVTAWLALSYWGADYHFETDFYLDETSKTLWIKGSGDPFLVSEELHLIAQKIAALGLKNINAIGLDDSLFQTNLKVPGSGLTTNPYDAIPSAIAANFNTLAIRKTAGQVISAELQTPLTSFAKKMAGQQQQLSKQILRINTGSLSRDAELYFAELLATFLRQQGVAVGKQVVWGKVPQQAVFYRHSNSRNLAEIIRPMMKYSTNFIANQLILMLSAEYFQRPANFNDVQDYMTQQVIAKFNWRNVILEEGAGLSRYNHLSPQQLVQLLEAFRPWKNLLPEVSTGIYAKSGTLNNISTLAGYIIDQNQHWNAFCLMMPQSVSHQRRNQIVGELALFSGKIQAKTLLSHKQLRQSMK